MRTKRRRLLWWTSGSLMVLLCLGMILAAYRFGWAVTGFPGKTVWDWLQLLIIPLVLALGALIFNQASTYTERQIAKQRYEQDLQITQDKQKEDLLQTYLDRMSELLLKENLRNSGLDDEVRKVARARTISILLQLDPKRIEYVFAFLRDASLMDYSEPLVDLKRANFSGVHWEGTDLSEANLEDVNFSGANLSNTKFGGTKLDHADFSGANLSGAWLSAVGLKSAILEGANFTGARIVTSIRNAKLKSANFSNADLTRTIFINSWLNDVNFSGADLSETRFDQCDLNNVNFTGANLEKANLSGAVGIDKNRLSSEQIAQAVF